MANLGIVFNAANVPAIDEDDDLEPDRDQIEIFVNALLRHAGNEGFVSLRAFHDNGGTKSFRITPIALNGGLKFLADAAEDDARRAATAPQRIVFCPPIAVFKDKTRAREQDLLRGLALSVELDQHPQEAREQLEQLLGPATVVVASGGEWIDPETDETQDKLHLHWRLSSPVEDKTALADLKAARDLAARLVGGDPSNKSVVHPIRWPGSWHRKGAPRLCQIVAADPDREIDLQTALATLKEASPAAAAAGNGKRNSSAPPGEPNWNELIGAVLSGESYHEPLIRLAAKLISSGMDGGTVVTLLRGWMEASTAPHDDRWQSRYDDIPRCVSTAEEKFRPPAEPITIGKTDSAKDAGTKTARSFEYRLLKDIEDAPYKRELVDDLLGEGELSIWFGAPKSGKSVILGDLACHIASDESEWCRHRIGHGAVLYVAAERRAVVERRLAAWRKHYGINNIPIAVIGGVFDLRSSNLDTKAIVATANKLAAETGVAVALIIIDTLAQVMAGGDENGPDMTKLVNNAALIQTEVGAHVALTHHVPHYAPERMRGHGSLAAAGDTHIRVGRHGDHRIAEVVASNDGPEDVHIHFTLVGVELGRNPENGKATKAPVVIPIADDSVRQVSAGTKPAPKLPPATQLALRALREAVDEMGVPAPASNHIPAGIKVVSLKHWRTYAYKRGISDTAEARKKAFKRAVQYLLAQGLVGTWGDLIWPI